MASFTPPRIGVLGGGQLGRMLAIAARQMDVRVINWTDGVESPVGKTADHTITASFDSAEAFEEFCSLVDVVTVEFENVPVALLEKLAERLPVRPAPSAVAICQNRLSEKDFLRSNGFPTTRFWSVDDVDGLARALEECEGASLLKTNESGYDGKGQLAIPAAGERADAETLWRDFGGAPAVLEARVDLAAEISVVVVRGANGEVAVYDPAENEHSEQILEVSIVPARVEAPILERVTELAKQIAGAMEYIGVLGVEFFIDRGGNVMINELAPRPHNTGHHTIDACETSQFEQQCRAVCGLPLGSTRLVRPVVMWNLLGRIWPTEDGAPDFDGILSTPGAKLHLYGKRKATMRRKMGHATFSGATIEEALAEMRRCRSELEARGRS